MKKRLTIGLLLAGLWTMAFSQAPGWKIWDQGNSGIPFKKVNSICFDKSGNIWIGTNVTTMTGHLSMFNGSSFSTLSPGSWIYDIECDVAGNIWLVNSNDQLMSYNNGTWNTYTSSLVEWYSDPLFIDDKGNKWMNPGFDPELLKFDGTSWTRYTTSNSGLPANKITAINGKDSLLYIGTKDSGLVVYNGYEWKRVHSLNSGLPDNRILEMEFDSGDTLWILCQGGTIAGLKGSTWKIYQSDSLPENCYGFSIDRNNNFWMVTSSIMVYYDKKACKIFDKLNSPLPEYNLVTVKVDRKTNFVWVGTRNGLFCYQPSGAEGITIQTQPTNKKVVAGSSVNFNIVALGDQLHYCWFKNATAIPGSDSCLLQLNNVGFADTGLYWCMVFNQEDTVYTDTVSLSLDNPQGISDVSEFYCIIYPNPTPGPVFIQTYGQSFSTAYVYDASGKELFTFDPSVPLDLKKMGLKPSVYFIRLGSRQYGKTLQIMLK